jgi:hypothetical protein
VRTRPTLLRAAVIGLVVSAIFLLRVHDIGQHFWMLGDQIRDWAIALGPFSSLPLVGPPTHVHGYTIGPAFYWILWGIRVLFGPFFSNLPHGGGIGQAFLESAADGLLCLAIWRRTGSGWLAVATVVLLATAPLDLALAAVIWNPIVGSTLARVAMALVLLDWPRGSSARTGVVAAVAWCAVHAYTGTIFVALSIFASLVADDVRRREWPLFIRRTLVVALVVALLQVPYLVYQMKTGFTDSGMTAVTDSLADLASGHTSAHLSASAHAYVGSLRSVEAAPGPVGLWAALLAMGAVVTAVGYRSDAKLLSVILLPQALAIVGYAFWRDFDSYYYLSLAPPAILTVVLALVAVVPTRAIAPAGAAFLVGVLALVPSRVARAAPLFAMPEYAPLAAGARALAAQHEPIRGIDSGFTLPPTCNPEFLYFVLGGQLDPTANRRAVIFRDGHVEYRPH